MSTHYTVSPTRIVPPGGDRAYGSSPTPSSASCPPTPSSASCPPSPAWTDSHSSFSSSISLWDDSAPSSPFISPESQSLLSQKQRLTRRPFGPRTPSRSPLPTADTPPVSIRRLPVPPAEAPKRIRPLPIPSGSGRSSPVASKPHSASSPLLSDSRPSHERPDPPAKLTIPPPSLSLATSIVISKSSPVSPIVVRYAKSLGEEPEAELEKRLSKIDFLERSCYTPSPAGLGEVVVLIETADSHLQPQPPSEDGTGLMARLAHHSRPSSRIWIREKKGQRWVEDNYEAVRRKLRRL